MNRRITRVAVAAVVMLGALIVGTTYWQTWASAGLADRQDNEIQRVAQFTIKRGTIYANDGTTVLAKNRAVKVGGKTLYYRTYPQRGLTAHVVGYSTVVRSQAGLERSFNDYLTGANGNLSSVFRSTFDKWRGVTVTGNDVYTTINAKAQKVALDALAGQCGAAVALNPRTGATLVMASSPTYNPNLIEKDFVKIGLTKAPCSGAAPLLNRATQGLFTPGSTFKIITAAAALDTGAFTPDSSFADPGYCTEYGKPVYNAGNLDQNGPEAFGRLDLTQGFQHSVNSVFCNIGKKIGAGTILRYAKRFGFYSVPPFDTPLNERAPSGLYNRSSLFDPRHPDPEVDPGRLAFGQERMLATPLQMAMVAGDGRHRRDRDAPVRREPSRRAERLRRLQGEARPARTRDQAEDREGAQRDDAARRLRRHRHRRPDPGNQGRGQDRNRRDQRDRPQHDVVRRLRARGQAARRVRGRAREPDRLRRHHGRADREADPAGPPTLRRETVTSTHPWSSPIPY